MPVSVISKPEGLCLSGNLPKVIVQSEEDVHIQLLQGSKILLDELYAPDFDNKVTLSFAEIVENELTFTMPEGSVYVQPSLLKTFTLKINDEIYTFETIRGGVKDLNDTPANFLRQNFLTWQPQEKKITSSQPEWLTYHTGLSRYMYVTLYFENDIPMAGKIANLAQGSIYTVNVNDIIESYPEPPVFLDIYVVNSDNAGAEKISYVQRYKIEEDDERKQKFFLFENSLGGLDTVCCTGESKTLPEYTIDKALMGDTERTFFVDKKEKRSQNTGRITRNAATWLQDFFASQKCYIYENDEIKPIVIDEVTAETSSIDDLIAFEFIYRPAVATKYLNIKRYNQQDPILPPTTSGIWKDHEFWIDNENWTE